ncbi:MAG TPA: hypothetical protein VII06_31375 [Chloroflexota bacterium]|jgi:hypothetical protein
MTQMALLLLTLALGVGPGAASNPGQTAGWVLTQSWGGSGDYRTDPFEIGHNEWLLEWEAQQALAPNVAGVPMVGLMQIEVHRMDDGGDSVVTTVNGSTPGAGNQVIQGGPGQYFLRVVAPALNWTMMAEEPGP